MRIFNKEEHMSTYNSVDRGGETVSGVICEQASF